MRTDSPLVKKTYDTIVIGGGQAGLATGYHLQSLQIDFIILDAAPRIGDAWRNRWDSLRLFTPNWANALPGAAFPQAKNLHAGKDEVAEFLCAYAGKYQLPVLSGTKVTGLDKTATGYQILSSAGIFNCSKVVIANGSYAIPKLPAFAKTLDPKIFQIHSSGYQRPADLPAGDVLVVGAGTSGIQIAIDVARTKRKTYMAGNPPPRIPGFILKYFGKLFVWFMSNVITIKTKPGRKVEHAIKFKGNAAPLINISVRDAEIAGASHVARVKTVLNGYPVLEDNRKLDIASVIWCTGYHGDFSWIHLNGNLDEKGYPLTNRGVSKTHPGLYYVGMTFQYALTSSWIGGVGRDAAYIANHIHKNQSGK